MAAIPTKRSLVLDLRLISGTFTLCVHFEDDSNYYRIINVQKIPLRILDTNPVSNPQIELLEYQVKVEPQPRIDSSKFIGGSMHIHIDLPNTATELPVYNPQNSNIPDGAHNIYRVRILDNNNNQIATGTVHQDEVLSGSAGDDR